MYRYDMNRAESREAYRWALQRVHARLVFRWHLVSFMLGCGLLGLINLLTLQLPGFPAFYWCVWPIAGWVITLALHFVQVYVFGERPPEAIRQRMLNRELERLHR